MAESEMFHVPALIRRVAAGASAVLALSVVYGMMRAFEGSPPNWAVFGFEVITLVAAAFGLVHGRGRFAEGPAFLYANMMAVIVIGTGLSLVSLQYSPKQVLVHPFMLGRLALVGLLGVLVLAVVFRRRASSWRAFLVGIVLTGAALGLAALAWATRGTWFHATAGVLRIVLSTLASIGGVVCLGLFCAGMHQVVRAFELGRGHNRVDSAPSVERHGVSRTVGASSSGPSGSGGRDAG